MEPKDVKKSEYVCTMLGVFLMGALFSWGLFGPFEWLKHLKSDLFVATATFLAAAVALLVALLGRAWQLEDADSKAEKYLRLAALRVVDQVRTWRLMAVNDIEDFSDFENLDAADRHWVLMRIAHGNFVVVPENVDIFLIDLLADRVIGRPLMNAVRTTAALQHFRNDPGPDEVGDDGSAVDPVALYRMAQMIPSDLAAVVRRLEEIIGREPSRPPRG